MRGPLKLIRERWMLDQPIPGDMHEYVARMKKTLMTTQELARKHLQSSQEHMNEIYDKKTNDRKFERGEEVLVMLPLNGQPFKAKYLGSFKIMTKISDSNYVIHTPKRQKKKLLCRINMLKKYWRRNKNQPVMIAQEQSVTTEETYEEDHPKTKEDPPIRLVNSKILENLGK